MDSCISLADRAGEVLLLWAAPMLLQSSLLVLFLFLLDGLLKKRASAGIRYTLWLLLLAKLLLPPSFALPTGLGALLPAPEKAAAPLPPALPETAEAKEAAPPAFLLLDLDLSSPGRVSPAGTTPARLPRAGAGETLTWRGALFLGWAGGALLLGLLLLSNLRKAARLLGSARPAPRALQELARATAAQVGLRRPFPLLLSREASSPFAIGLLRPKVILPASTALEVPPEGLRTVLLHEALHIKRWDLPVNFLQGLLQVFYFFHPLLWFANRTIRRTREEAVDESVLYFAEKEKEMYIQSLLALARKSRKGLLPSQALLGILERESHLASRIRRVLALTPPARPGGGPRAWVLFAALGAFLLPMARPQPPARNPGAAEKAPGPGAARPQSPRPQAEKPPASSLLAWAGAALPLALDWLARHQDEDGKWSASRFNAHCKGARCSGPGAPIHDVGVTGLALLAFLESGETLREGLYRTNLKKGLLWLKDQQNQEGLFGGKTGQAFMYSHLIATIAMTRAMGESRFRLLKFPVQKALDYISQARNPYKAWRYYPRSGENDTSVTGWAVTALAWAKAYADLGLKVSDDNFQGASDWFDEMTDPKTGRVGYITKGSPPARPEALVDRFPADKSESITAVALAARFMMGLDPAGQPLMAKGLRLLQAKPPAWKDGSIDMYYWYYGTLAARAAGGKFWKDWREKVLSAILPRQRTRGCARGSWDPAGVWGEEGGRVYATALMAGILDTCLAKEVRLVLPLGKPRKRKPLRLRQKFPLLLTVKIENREGKEGPKFRLYLQNPNVPPGMSPTVRQLPLEELLPELKKERQKGAQNLILQVFPGVPGSIAGKILEKIRLAGFNKVEVDFPR